MTTQALIEELTRHGVRLRLVGESQLSLQAPRGSVSEALRQRVAEHKAMLVQWLQGRRNAAEQDLPGIEPDWDNRHAPFAFSELQASFHLGQGEGMEFHVRPHHYHEEDHPDLDVERWQAALNRALERQRFNLPVVREDGRLQVPAEFAPVSVRVHDLRSMDAAAVRAALERVRARMARQLLPLDRWPWIAVEASCLPDGGVRLHINNNNFFSDGYGTQRLFQQVKALYRDPRLELVPLQLTYRDAVRALAAIEASPLGEASWSYWQERVPQLPGPPPLPRAPGVATRVRSHLERREVRLPAPLWAQFKSRAQGRGITLSSALTAVHAEVLATWSGARHFVLNHMATHRFALHPQMREIVGNFASLYPLEVDWREPAAFEERARRLQQRLTEDMRHLYCSGNRVLQAMNQAQHTLGRAPCPFVVGSGLFMSPWEQTGFSCLETPQVLLDYQFWETAGGELLAVWDVIEAQFPAGLIDAMQGAHEALLRRLAMDDAAWGCHAFELLPPAQRAQRRQVNDTAQPLPQGRLHDGLARHAAQRPSHPAVIDAGGMASYAELHSRVQSLAADLRAHGIGRGQRVAVCLPKGLEQAVAVHGVLASGAAYVPLDPQWPAERIEALLHGVAASAVITPAGLQVAAQHPPNPAPEDLAYVVFTSGSTGVPKGVMVGHRAALNTVLDVNRRFGVSGSDVILGLSSLCFDLSVYDLFGACQAGATLVLPPAADEPQPQAWLSHMVRHGVTVWNSVPALMQLLVDAAEARQVQLPCLRLVLLSGDWIPVGLPGQVRRMAPNARVISLGGATEAGIWSIFHPAEEVPAGAPSVPYGVPLANQRWCVLDEAGHDSPTWVPGHLHIAGAGLAMGYWGDEAKTAAAFVSHPQTGERLYRTGDMGRYLPDGCIEFLGRADLQIKVQGFRIEPGEIEAAMLQHAGVQAAVVVATGEAAGRQLVGFFTMADGSAEATGALRAHLMSRLPSYMVPAQLTPLAAWPLTPNGKVDRQALGRHVHADTAVRVHEPPRGEAERALLALWEEVLETRPIGVTDDFFDLGGQSFAAVRLMTRIAQRLGQRVPIGVLLEHRTVRDLAAHLEDRGNGPSVLVALRAQGVGTPWFLVHPAGGSVLCYRALAARLPAPCWALQAPGTDGGQAPLETVEALAQHHIDALRARRPRGPYVLGGWSSGGTIAFDMARRLEADGERVAHVVMIDAPAPLQSAEVDDATLLRWFIEDLNLGVDAAAVALEEAQAAGAGGPAGRLQRVLSALPALSALAGIDAQRLAPVLQVFSAVVRAGRRYRLQAPIDAPITVIKARDQRVTEFADHPGVAAPDWGWGPWSHGGVQAFELPGAHHTLLAEPHVEALASTLATVAGLAMEAQP